MLWQQTLDDLPRFLTASHGWLFAVALGNTLALSALGAGLGFLLGFGLAVLRHDRLLGRLPTRWLAVGYVELLRRIPFLVKLMCVFFAFQLSGLNPPLFVIAATAVTLSAAAFAAEIARGGLESVPATQWDAAEAMNMSRARVLFTVVLPQAWRVILPPGIGFLVGFIKSTSIASQVGVLEVTYAAKALNAQGFSALLCFGAALLLYFAVCWPLKLLGESLERRLARRVR